MKTKDFLERVKALGLQPIANEDVVVVYASDYPLTLARIRNAYERSFELDLDAGQAINIDKQRSLMELVVEYGMTPIEEREDEKRWYIHLSKGGCNYLNQDKETGTYELDDKHEINDYKTEFTRSEIEDWAGTNSDEIIDWIIDKFGEEVE